MLTCYRLQDWSKVKRQETLLVAESVRNGNQLSKEIAKDTGIPAPTVHRLLHALEVTRFVDGIGGRKRGKRWHWVEGADINRLKVQ